MMNATLATRLAGLALLTLVLADPAALALDARRGRAQRSEGLTLSVGMEGGTGDDHFGGNLFQPFVTVGRYEEGLDWEGRLRCLFSDEDGGVRSSGFDCRGMIGWGWKQSGSYDASVFAGASFRTLRVETDDDQPSHFGPDKYDCQLAAAEFGAYLRMPGGQGVDLIGQVSWGPVLAFSDDQSNGREGGFSDSYVFEVYLGCNWTIPDFGASLSVGGAYEQLKVARDDGLSVNMETLALRVGLTWKF
jgi:hypothetical protein